MADVLGMAYPSVRIFVTPPLAIHSCGISTALFRIQDRISSAPTHLRDQMHSPCKLDLELLGAGGSGGKHGAGMNVDGTLLHSGGDPRQDLGCVILSLSSALFSQERVSLPTGAQLLQGRREKGTWLRLLHYLYRAPLHARSMPLNYKRSPFSFPGGAGVRSPASTHGACENQPAENLSICFHLL